VTLTGGIPNDTQVPNELFDKWNWHDSVCPTLETSVSPYLLVQQAMKDENHQPLQRISNGE